jgi:hypothetical protein
MSTHEPSTQASQEPSTQLSVESFKQDLTILSNLSNVIARLIKGVIVKSRIPKSDTATLGNKKGLGLMELMRECGFPVMPEPFFDAVHALIKGKGKGEESANKDDVKKLCDDVQVSIEVMMKKSLNELERHASNAEREKQLSFADRKAVQVLLQICDYGFELMERLISLKDLPTHEGMMERAVNAANVLYSVKYEYHTMLASGASNDG